VNRAFRLQLRTCHYDLFPDDPEAAERFRLHIEAGRVLRDPALRATYDSELAEVAERARVAFARVEEERKTRHESAPRFTRAPKAQPQSASPPPQSPFTGWGSILAVATVVTGVAALASQKNGWDQNVGQYRAKNGQFRGGLFG